jgi:2-polyprenyl-3-methyl-5-hydroxy-6-metoxy-1,4-benzoquinol methylase
MSDTRNTEFDLDVLMRRIRDEVARRKAAAGHEAATTDSAPVRAVPRAEAPLLETIALPRLPESSGSIARKDRYTIGEFLAFQDEDFVCNAYRGILRREPDPVGFSAYLEAMRQGRRAKVEVLGRMRFSAEGRTAGVPVRGLPLRFALRLVCRVPVLGRMLGIVHYLFRLPDIVRNHEQLEAAFFQRKLELNRQINTVKGKIERGITQLQRSLQDIGATTRANIDSVRAALDTLASGKADAVMLETLVADFGTARREDMATAAALERSVEALACRTAADLQTMRTALDALASGKADAAMLETLVVDFGTARREDMATAAALAARITELQAAKTDAIEFGSVVGELRKQFLASDHILREQERRLAVLIEAARSKYRGTAHGAEPAALAQEAKHLFDAFYAAFENRFRGTPEDIRQRVAVFLPVIREAHAGTAKATVLDIGCGRGEWLELLKENGFAARGVDLNSVTVAECRERGLAVVEGDAIEHLRGLKADSLGAVTAMHVIEHIPFRRLIVLLDEVLRALRPGGVAIFETPNPENLMVGACSFYSDPTHERPLPPEATQFVAESRGFVDTSIMRLHPVPEGLQLADGAPAVRELINRVFYGAQDYALIARKPK